MKAGNITMKAARSLQNYVLQVHLSVLLPVNYGTLRKWHLKNCKQGTVQYRIQYERSEHCI